MEFRKLGRTELEVSPLCFGGNVFGWTVDEATSFSLLDRFVDAGLNFIDTADAYSAWAPGNIGGESETIIGNWLKSRGLRHKVIIATKVGSEMGPDEKAFLPAISAKPSMPPSSGCRPTISIFISPTGMIRKHPSRMYWEPIKSSSQRARCAQSAHQPHAATPY